MRSERSLDYVDHAIGALDVRPRNPGSSDAHIRSLDAHRQFRSISHPKRARAADIVQRLRALRQIVLHIRLTCAERLIRWREDRDPLAVLKNTVYACPPQGLVEPRKVGIAGQRVGDGMRGQSLVTSIGDSLIGGGLFLVAHNRETPAGGDS